MKRIRVLTPTAGTPSWQAGEVVELDDDLAVAWADGLRAVEVDKNGNDVTQRIRKPGDLTATAVPTGEKAVAPPQVPPQDGEPDGEQADDDPPLTAGTIDEVLARVGTSPLRAAAAIEEERAAAKPRSTLLDQLTAIAEG